MDYTFIEINQISRWTKHDPNLVQYGRYHSLSAILPILVALGVNIVYVPFAAASVVSYSLFVRLISDCGWLYSMQRLLPTKLAIGSS